MSFVSQKVLHVYGHLTEYHCILVTPSRGIILLIQIAVSHV